MLEKDLFPPLKKHFKELGYKVYAEVPTRYHTVDFVAVKGKEQIAVEMKVRFNNNVIYQAFKNCHDFTKSYIATPIKPDKNSNLLEWCLKGGLGIFQIKRKKIILKILEARINQILTPYDFSTFKESDNDEAGIQFNRGKSSAFVVLDRVKDYVSKHQRAGWREIYANVQNHYSSHRSLAISMKQWKGFDLEKFKISLFRIKS